MKKIYASLLVMLTTVFFTQQSIAQGNYERDYDLSDYLDLQAVASVFSYSRNLNDFENNLNDYRNQVSNLDLNNDGYVDYLRLIKVSDSYNQVILIQAVLGNNYFQDVATIVVGRDNWGRDYVQIIGEPYLYGNDYILEPVFSRRPPIVWFGHRFFINQFDECWIPDHAGKDNLSGDLSHKYPLPKQARFIGPLSRFSTINADVPEKLFPIVALISGPEPQRSLFDQEVLQWLRNQEQIALLIRGLPASSETIGTVDQITLLNHLTTEKLAGVLLHSKIIICRSGYSTLMDLDALGVLHKAYVSPTPGQTEQEYLARYLIKKTAGYFPAV